jgi:hypothetical protein
MGDGVDKESDPERVQQESPGRKPWEPTQIKGSALKGRRRLLRPSGLYRRMFTIPGLTPWAFLPRPFGA